MLPLEAYLYTKQVPTLCQVAVSVCPCGLCQAVCPCMLAVPMGCMALSWASNVDNLCLSIFGIRESVKEGKCEKINTRRWVSTLCPT